MRRRKNYSLAVDQIRSLPDSTKVIQDQDQDQDKVQGDVVGVVDVEMTMEDEAAASKAEVEEGATVALEIVETVVALEALVIVENEDAVVVAFVAEVDTMVIHQGVTRLVEDRGLEVLPEDTVTGQDHGLQFPLVDVVRHLGGVIVLVPDLHVHHLLQEDEAEAKDDLPPLRDIDVQDPSNLRAALLECEEIVVHHLRGPLEPAPHQSVIVLLIDVHHLELVHNHDLAALCLLTKVLKRKGKISLFHDQGLGPNQTSLGV
jgi:hypothetical protein